MANLPPVSKWGRIYSLFPREKTAPQQRTCPQKLRIDEINALHELRKKTEDWIEAKHELTHLRNRLKQATNDNRELKEATEDLLVDLEEERTKRARVQIENDRLKQERQMHLDMIENLKCEPQDR